MVDQCYYFGRFTLTSFLQYAFPTYTIVDICRTTVWPSYDHCMPSAWSERFCVSVPSNALLGICRNPFYYFIFHLCCRTIVTSSFLNSFCRILGLESYPSRIEYNGRLISVSICPMGIHPEAFEMTPEIRYIRRDGDQEIYQPFSVFSLNFVGGKTDILHRESLKAILLLRLHF